MTDISGCVILTSCCGTVCAVSTMHGELCAFISTTRLAVQQASSEVPPRLFLLFLSLILVYRTLFLNSFSLTPPISVPPLSTARPSLPLSVCTPLPSPPPPPLPFLPFALGSGAKVGWRTEANTAQGRAEGDPKAGQLIMCVFAV